MCTFETTMNAAFGINLIYKFLLQIQGRVVYAEDNIYRLMMFEGSVGRYYNRETMYYEVGTGISTSGNTKWEDRLKRDWLETNRIMIEKEDQTEFQQSIVATIERKEHMHSRALSWLLIKGQFIWGVKKRFFARYSNIERGM